MAIGDESSIGDEIAFADWIVRACEARTAGVMNATGPGTTLTMERFLTACQSAGGSVARLVWADEGFLLASGVGPYSELPLWVPERFRVFAPERLLIEVLACVPFHRHSE